MLKWATWDQAAIASVLSIAAFALIRRSRPSKAGNALLPAFGEFALISALYSIWQVARQLPLTHEGGALGRARQIDDLQQDIRSVVAKRQCLCTMPRRLPQCAARLA